jgi:hypothetical protein
MSYNELATIDMAALGLLWGCSLGLLWGCSLWLLWGRLWGCSLCGCSVDALGLL